MKSLIFVFGQIVAFPTNTSFGLGVRADDKETLQKLYDLKQRPEGKYFSLMVRDMDMLREFAEVPNGFPNDFFTETPRTVILKPKEKLPLSKFWPADKVAFRVATLPKLAEQINYPITATSANLSGQSPIFEMQKIHDNFGDAVKPFPSFTSLVKKDPSEIWDYTTKTPARIR